MLVELPRGEKAVTQFLLVHKSSQPRVTFLLMAYPGGGESATRLAYVLCAAHCTAVVQYLTVCSFWAPALLGPAVLRCPVFLLAHFAHETNSSYLQQQKANLQKTNCNVFHQECNRAQTASG